MNYQEAGVDVEKGDQFVNSIGSFIRSTYDKNVKAGVGGFAALYEQGDNYLVAGTDGVGTKLMLARELDHHETIGQDLVAMCVNDILCTGAMPLFFLDYLATGKLTPDIHEQVIKSISQACLLSQCALIGGETAEMPGCYEGADYDLAGFAVGQVSKANLVDGSKVTEGMSIIGLPASGFHSNGFSLIRKVIEDSNLALKQACLTPTRIYRKEVETALRTNSIFGMAHITGGGLNNIQRINPGFKYKIDTMPELPCFMQEVVDLTELNHKDLFQTFNMGIGYCFITDSPQKLLSLIPDTLIIGRVETGSGVECLGTEI